MKKRNFVFLVLTFFGFFLSAKAARTEPARPVVISIEITSWQAGVSQHLVLTDDKKMSMILGYLRATNGPFPAEDIPSDESLMFHAIRVHLSDGTSHLYEQLTDQYFRKDGDRWKIIDPDQGNKLSKLEKFAFSNTL